MMDWLYPTLLGLIEGLTEFLPVSSTGHLILAEQLLNWSSPPGKVFEVVIQLGAILAVCVLYFRRLWGVLVRIPSDPGARNFAICIIAAAIPAVLAGVFLHSYIKEVLFNPVIVSIALIVGGIAIIVVERFFDPRDEFDEVEQFNPMLAFKIGLFQLLALVPGVSRSGSTIIGATLLGASRKAATEFSFFVAIPLMFGAAFYDLYKNWNALSDDNLATIGIGFVGAFISALLVVNFMVDFVKRNGFTLFGWYRIIVGTIMLLFLI